MDDERSEAIRQAAGEVARHLAWLRDAGVREVPAPTAVAAVRSAPTVGPVEGGTPPAVEPPPPRPASLRPAEPVTRSAPPRDATAAPGAIPAARTDASSAASGAGAGKGTGSPALLAIREDLGDCRRCKLHGGRTTLVFGVGDPHAELMFVGEGPGRTRTSRASRSSARPGSC